MRIQRRPKYSSELQRSPFQPSPAPASPSAAERLPAAPVSPRPASAPPSPAPPASCAGDADPNPVPSGFEPLTQNAYHQLEQVGNYLLKTLAQGPDAAPPSRAAVTPLPAASSTSTAAAAHLPTRFVGGDQLNKVLPAPRAPRSPGRPTARRKAQDPAIHCLYGVRSAPARLDAQQVDVTGLTKDGGKIRVQDKAQVNICGLHQTKTPARLPPSPS